MIELYLGAYGHGKSTAIIKKIEEDYNRLKEGGFLDSNGEQRTRSILIVPEQQTLVSERQLAASLPSTAQLFVEATNFTRLADSVFRKTGGLKYNFITKSAQNLLMYQTICELRGAKAFKHYKDIPFGHEKNYIGTFLQAIGELKAYCVTVPLLEKALAELKKTNSKGTVLLRAKLSDIIKVWAYYDNELKKNYDDPYDTLLMLREKLGSNYFNGCNVYIDSFYGFTKSQLDVVAKIIESADNVTIALDCPIDADENTLQYKKIVATKNRIIHLCKRLKKECKTISFDTDYKHKYEELEYLCDNLWDFSKEPILQTNRIALVKADDEFSECEYVCTKIKEIISNAEDDEKYGNIAIIARNSSTYQGIIDFCLDKFQIPYHFSAPSKLNSEPVIKMVFSALNAISGMRAEDIITYIKCGYTDIDDNDLYSLEKYIYRWNIYGSKFTKDDYWGANPDGYKKGFSPEQADELERICNARKKILNMLNILKEPFSLGLPVKDCAVAVYNFLEAHNVRNKLLTEVKDAEGEDAQELSQVWGALIDALRSIVSICGDIVADESTFLTLLNYAMMDVKIGTIPAREDTVVIADASLVRAKNIRHVFVLGANEGVFPAVVNDDSFFSDADKLKLETVNINLSGEAVYIDDKDEKEEAFLSAKTQERRDDELLFFKNSIAVASHSVTVCSLKKSMGGSIQRPSVGFSRVEDLLYKLDPKNSGKQVKPDIIDYSTYKVVDKIYTEENAKDFYGVSKGNLKKAIEELCKVDDLSKATKGPKSFKTEENFISEDTVNLLFQDIVTLAPTPLESFQKCHFNYYCSHILGLKNSDRITFAHNNVGDLVHKVFEDFLKANRTKPKTYNQKEIFETVTKMTDEYTKSLCGSQALSNKMKHFFGRLKKTISVFVEVLLEENRASGFKNRYNELEIPDKDGNYAPLPAPIPIDNGRSVVLQGKIDRVDVCNDNKIAYLKIIDYKTGTHTYDKKKLEKGLDMQMLIYLMSLYEMSDCKFKTNLLRGAEDILPYGIEYLTYNIDKTEIDKEVDINSAIAIENEEKCTKKKISRSGMEIDENRLKSSVDEFNLKKKSMGDFTDFEEVFKVVKEKVKEIGNTLISGDASAIPLEGETPCDFCKNGAICRRRKKSARFN